MVWQEKEYKLRAAGFSDQEIADAGQKKRDTMLAAGFAQKEVDTYFGVKEPDPAPMKGLVESGYNYLAGAAEAFESGLDNSSGAMVVKALQGKRVTPDQLLPEDADTFYRIASQVGTIAGDLPAMAAGAFIGTPVGAAAGGAAGSALPVVGNVAGAATGAILGAGAGGNALPTAIRETLMQYYEKGEIHDFKDFWERFSAVSVETVKSGTIGAATVGVGGKVLKSVSKVATPVVGRVASTSSEIATMVTLGKGFEGEVPTAQDFIDGAITVAGLTGAVTAAGKIRTIYGKTNQKPFEVIEEAKINPVVKQELLTTGNDIPAIYKNMAEESSPLGSARPSGQVETPLPTTPEAKILSKIGSIEKASEPFSVKNLKDEFYKDFVDKLDPINRAVEELGEKVSDLPAEANPYKLARLASDSKAKALHFIEKGPIDYATLETTGKGLNEIFKPIENDLNGFRAYVVSKRALELEGRGIQSGFDLDAAKEVVAKGKKTFETAQKEFVDWQNASIKYAKDAGIISEKTYENLIAAGEDYVSFKRILEDEGFTGFDKKNPIKAIKGSDLDIQDPILSAVEKTENLLSLAERNRSSKALIDLAEEGVFKKAESDSKRALGSDEFQVFRDGKREIYKAEDPALAQAFKLLDGDTASQNIFQKIARGVSTTKRLGISLMPDFVLRNFIRDQVTAGVFSKAGGFTPLDVMSAMKDIISKNDNYYTWLKSGGANGAFLDIGQKYLDKNVFKLNQETSFIDQTWNVIKKPVDYLGALGTLAEQSTRLAEAKRVLKAGGSLFDAGYASREITIDFQRIGAKMSALNQITAFQNAGIQGLDRSIRALKEDPKGIALRAGLMITGPSVLLWFANKDDQRVREIPQWQKDLFWIVPTDNWQVEAMPGEASTLPSHLVREGKDGKKEINKGVIYRIPKPQELGLLFGSLPERALDLFFSENPQALKGFGETIGELISPSILPDISVPILEQMTNKSFFTQRPVVPFHLENQLPQAQYTDYTTDTAKALGRMVMAVPYFGSNSKTPLSSPMVIENYVRSWAGSTGMYALQLADKGLQAAGLSREKNTPDSTLADIPFIKAFVVRFPSAGAKSLQEFNEIYERNSKVINTIKSLSKRGDFEGAQAIATDPENADKLVNLEGVREAIRNQQNTILSIYRNPEISSAEKRQLIDGIYFGMIESAKMGTSLVQSLEASAKAKDE